MYKGGLKKFFIAIAPLEELQQAYPGADIIKRLPIKAIQIYY